MLDLLGQVSLPAQSDFLNLRSRQLSVGQGQRLLIALALIHRPSLIVADEPTSALDLITQQEICGCSAGSATSAVPRSCSSLTISCRWHRSATGSPFLFEGEIIEIGWTQEVFEHPKHPYAQTFDRSTTARGIGFAALGSCLVDIR